MASAGRASIRDVAKRANVSLTTASHALNDKGRINPETRARVLDAAKALGYAPNISALNLRSGRTRTIGLALPDDGDARPGPAAYFAVDYYMEVTMAAVATAFEHEHALIVLPPLRGLPELRRLAMDGAIVVSARHDDRRLTLFEAAGLPTVSLDDDPTRGDAWAVKVDTYANTIRMLDHLRASGARRIAVVTPELPWAWVDGTDAAAEEWIAADGGPHRLIRVRGDRDPASVAAAIGELLDRPDPPDAVFALAQWIAAGARSAAAERDLSIPDDLMLAVGIDSTEARTSTPPLTALDLRPADVTREAVALLLARLEGAPPLEHRAVPGRLIARDSTAR